MPETIIDSINYNQLTLNLTSIYKMLGYPPKETPDFVIDLTDELVAELPLYADIKGGYQIRDNLSIENKSVINIDELEFFTGSIITTQLRKASGIIVFVCSLGERFDEWSKKIISEGDMLKGFIVDVLGSELIEAAVDFLEAKIYAEVKSKGLKITNRYSPGYCDWNVSEQHKLFSLLPERCCNITLTDSALMKPIKSVSGIIGIGEDVKKNKYTCSICSMENCYLRVRESD